MKTLLILNSEHSLIKIFYYIGLAVCSVFAIENTKGINSKYIWPILGIITLSFGGGVHRDAILNVHPWLLSPNSLQDVGFVFLIASVYLLLRKFLTKTKAFQYFISLADYAGIISCIPIGVDRSNAVGCDFLVSCLAGYITALFGGLSFRVFSKQFVKILDISYLRLHVITLICSVIYALTKNAIYIIPVMPLLLIATETDYNQIINMQYIYAISLLIRIPLYDTTRRIYDMLYKRHKLSFSLKIVGNYITTIHRIYILLHKIRVLK